MTNWQKKNIRFQPKLGLNLNLKNNNKKKLHTFAFLKQAVNVVINATKNI